MAPLRWTFLLFCFGRSIIVSQLSTCSHAQCVYDYVTAKADCSSLNLDCIPVNYPSSVIMDLSHNQISELSPDDFNGIFSRLAELYLDYNAISDVTSLLGSNEMGSLHKLSVTHNVISYLPTQCNLTSLTDLVVDYNLITYLSDIPSCNSLQRFSADFNLIQNNFVSSSHTSNMVVSIQFNKLSYVYFDGSAYTDISLLLDHNKLTSLVIRSFSFFGYLAYNIISLNHNRLRLVSMNSIPNTLNIGSNGLQNWDWFNLNWYRNTMNRLDISNNSFDSLIQPRWAEGLELLNADTNLLANLSSTTLAGFVDLTELHVANNRLLFISPTALSQLSMLQSLYLDDNALTSLFGGVFFNQSNLVELSITNNRLTLLHPDYFMGLVSLESLYLAGNQLTSVNSQMFQMVPQILTLDLSRNELQLVDLQDCALNLTNLQNLSLAHNLIHDAITVLGFCNNLQILDMSFNLIQVVPGDSLSWGNRALSKLELEGNPLQCDCRLTSLRDWLQHNPPYVEPRCEGPKQHYGSVVTDLETSNFSCQPPMTMTDKDVTVVAGQTATLECTATGIPTPTITWLTPNGTKITHEWQGRFAILQGRILHITPVENSDQGVYTCLAKNVLGEVDRAVVNVTVTNPDSPISYPSPSPNTPPFSLQLSVSDIPTICITFALTCLIAALIILFRRLYKRKYKGTISNHGIKKVGFRKDDTTGTDAVYMNEIFNEDCETPNDQRVARKRYMATHGRGNYPPCQTDAETYENVSEGNEKERKNDDDVYEIVSVSCR